MAYHHHKYNEIILLVRKNSNWLNFYPQKPCRYFQLPLKVQMNFFAVVLNFYIFALPSFGNLTIETIEQDGRHR